MDLEDYMNIANDYVDLLVRSYGDELVSVYLFGSVARGDFLKGYSDVELILVFKEGTHDDEMYALAKQIHNKYGIDETNKEGQLELFSFTRSDFKKCEHKRFGSSKLTILNLFDSGKLLFGEDLIRNMKRPILMKKDIVNLMKGNIDLYDLRVDEYPYNMLGLPINQARFFLLSKGVNVDGKEKIVEAYEKKFGKSEELEFCLNYRIQIKEFLKDKPLRDRSKPWLRKFMKKLLDSVT